MCGIVGILNLADGAPVQEQVLRQMLAMIRHRGPDQFGIYLEDQVGLGNARLSIIDLKHGQQPIPNEDETLWIVFNGEIFNYPELRPELEQRGHRFATNCDTETILHVYEEFGPDCLQRLNGQFAIAIWDTRDRSLFLAPRPAGRPAAVLHRSRRHPDLRLRDQGHPGGPARGGGDRPGGAGPDLHLLEHPLAAHELPRDPATSRPATSCWPGTAGCP